MFIFDRVFPFPIPFRSRWRLWLVVALLALVAGRSTVVQAQDLPTRGAAIEETTVA